MVSVPHSRESTPTYPSSWKLQIHVIVIQMRNVFHRLLYLRIWSLVSGTSWTGYGNLGMWSLAGGGTPLGVGLESLQPRPTLSALSASTSVWNLDSQLLADLPPMLCRPSMFLSALSDCWWWQTFSFIFLLLIMSLSLYETIIAVSITIIFFVLSDP